MRSRPGSPALTGRSLAHASARAPARGICATPSMATAAPASPEFSNPSGAVTIATWVTRRTTITSASTPARPTAAARRTSRAAPASRLWPTALRATRTSDAKMRTAPAIPSQSQTCRLAYEGCGHGGRRHGGWLSTEARAVPAAPARGQTRQGTRPLQPRSPSPNARSATAELHWSWAGPANPNVLAWILPPA
jgi:hypothetical protein